MSGKGQAAGQAFLQSVLSKISDPGLKQQAEQVFANAAIQTEIGGGVLGQSEVDRQLQELRTKETDLQTKTAELDDRETRLTTWHDQLTTWYGEKKDLMEIGAEAKKAGFDPKNPNANAGKGGKVELPANVVTEDKLNEIIAGERSSFLGFSLEQNQLMKRHYETFGKLLDVEPLLRHPEIKNRGLAGVYEIVHKDALEAKATNDQKAAEDKIRADERAKVLAGNQMPYPLPTGAGSGSPLDALETKGNAPVVDAAVAEYARLQAARG